MAEQGPASGGGRREVPERLTIGLVTANIHLGVGATLWSGALRAAERDDVNLVCFPGGSLRPGGEASRSALYDLVDRARLDGVVCWSSTLGLPASGDHAERLLRSLRRLPVVSLNHALEGVDDHETLHARLVRGHAGARRPPGRTTRRTTPRVHPRAAHQPRLLRPVPRLHPGAGPVPLARGTPTRMCRRRLRGGCRRFGDAGAAGRAWVAAGVGLRRGGRVQRRTGGGRAAAARRAGHPGTRGRRRGRLQRFPRSPGSPSRR